MRIPDQVKLCVVFIGELDARGGLKYVGTGFMVGIHSSVDPSLSFKYLVTARHVVDGLDGSDIFLQALQEDGTPVIAQGANLPWTFHPDPDVDVACLALSSLGPLTDFTVVPIAMLLTADERKRSQIGIGDEVFVMGLFTRLRETVEPLARVGTIAMMPTGKVVSTRTKSGRFAPIEAILIDQRSLGGTSGGPVFVRETVRIGDLEWGDGLSRPLSGGGRIHLLGLMHGHWTVDPSQATDVSPAAGEFPYGMSIVIPAEKILETLMRSELIATRAKEDEILIASGHKQITAAPVSPPH